MNKQIFLFLGLLISITSMAQKDKNKFFLGAFYADKSTIYEKKNDLPSILNSKNEIEIRLLIREAWSSPRYIVLAFNENWSVTEYKYSYKDSTYVSSSERTDKALETTFQNLVKNNVFALPNNDKSSYCNYDLKTNKVEKISSFITDGNSYSVEFKVGENYRAYGFNQPESYAEFEPSNHKLADFNSIVSIMKLEIDK